MKNILPKILEILFYAAVDLFPSLILALAPFSKFMRFSPLKTGMFVLFLYLFVSISRFLALSSLFLATVLTVFWIVLYLTFYLLCIQADIRKLLFVLLIILNYGSFVAILYSCILSRYFYGTAGRLYSFSSTLLLAAIYAVSFPIVYRLMHHKLRPLMEASENNPYWSFLWLVPAVFCLSYYYNMYSNGGIILFTERLSNVLFGVIYNLGALFVTYLTAHLMEICNANLRLASENHMLNMQSVQYENLQSRMDDARRANHDLRQFLAVISTYLKDNNKDELTEYLREFTQSLPSVSPICYCENYAVNSLIVYYETIAAKNNIRFTGDVDCPKKALIADADAVVLLGNLLENAVEACRQQPHADPFITLCVKNIQDAMVITLDNSCRDPIQTANGRFLSSKGERVGMGTESIKKIALKYNGIVKFEYDSSEFHVSVLLSGQP